MIIPNSIKIGGHLIKIQKVNCSELKNHGEFDNWFKCIRLNTDGVTEDTITETLLHEIFEAIKSNYNLDLDHKDLTIISEVLFAVIRDNALDFRNKEIDGKSN